MKILACSDIHLGRICGVEGDDLTGSSAWEAVVETAIAQQVDALVLAGDIVDKDKYWFEAYGPLLRGFDRLHEAGIAIVAVAGNHDSSISPKLIEEKPFVNILGLGGEWEYLDLNGVRFVGWSFKESHYKEDPFETFPKEFLDTASPILGLLHCEVDGASSYAPVPAHRFEGSAFWVLGHIHKPIVTKNYLNCGSPFALDRGETGDHGVFLIELEGSHWSPPKMISLTPHRFEECSVELDPLTTEENIGTYINKAIREVGERIAEENYSGRLYCRLTFRGRVKPELELNKVLNDEDLNKLEVDINPVLRASPVGNYKDETTLELDLERIGGGTGIKGLLANQLINFDTKSDLYTKLEKMIKESANEPTFQALGEANLSVEELFNIAGQRLLRAMVKQGEDNE
ncbi:MAG: metallophosphoesterase family protein [Sphaerochaetaceae bacterium]|jgi:exonuclease SbcD|nr:DNA repair exonuclease [Sphaerochaetaceae bacterium]HHU89397.1 DNA repair exonuclease [Spirochaetales bacterium]